MVLIQIILGGVTRLTGSGLSITKWEIVTGTLPPVNESQWLREFDLYKQTPQFEMINSEMDLRKFKFIYFWEYVHRLWARLMGFVFLIPLGFFFFKGWIPKWLVKHLGLIFLLAAGTASAGWIMVQSGLIEGPWVNAYKLTGHLIMACFTLMALLHTFLKSSGKKYFISKSLKRFATAILFIMIIQICMGGLVAGMRSAIAFPTWPDMNGSFIPEIIFNSDHSTVDNVINYGQSQFAPALSQFIHRMVGYVLYVLIFIFSIKLFQKSSAKKCGQILLILIHLQVLLGIFTLIYSKGHIPIVLAVSHQLFAFILLLVVYASNYGFPARAELDLGG